MYTRRNLPLQSLIDELKNLVHEIEEQPSTSSWVIRMSLKAIVDKTEKMATETVQDLVGLEEIELSDSLRIKCSSL